LKIQGGAMSSKPKILVVDDDVRMVQVLRVLLEESGYTVISAFNGKEGLRAAYAEHPDLVLLDIRMPEMDGFQALDALRMVTDIPIVLLTGDTQDTYRVRGLDKGAADYLVKSTSPEVILAHIRSRLRGATTWKIPKVRQFGQGLTVDFSKRMLTLQERPVHLTPIEWKLFQCLVEHEGRVVQYDDLLNACWDIPEFRDVRAVKVKIAALRNKLHDRAFQSHWIHTIREEGYMFEAR
jgi:DNA-binding response OmpR family regulator